MILLDTHTLIWFATDNAKLSARARAILLDTNESLYISSASAWEIATKVRLGKLPDAEPLREAFAEKFRALGYTFLSITVDHSLLAGSFIMSHKDPFDRLIAAQASLEKMPLLSADRTLDAFPIQRVW